MTEYSIDQLIRHLEAHPDDPFAKAHWQIVHAYEGSQRQMARFTDDDRAKDPLGYELARGYNLGISRAVSELVSSLMSASGSCGAEEPA